VRLEGLGQLKKKYNDLIGNRTRDIPSCNSASTNYATDDDVTSKIFREKHRMKHLNESSLCKLSELLCEASYSEMEYTFLNGGYYAPVGWRFGHAISARGIRSQIILPLGELFCILHS
jgi:hypothetical protein